MTKIPDIDIDFVDRTQALCHFKHIVASRFENNDLVKHNTGVYLHPVPLCAEKNICAIDYINAEKHNFFKVDFLNVGIYKGVKDEDHLNDLMNREPLWELLEQEEFVNLLFHINGHSQILKELRPTSIEQLAAVLAIIRPAKKYLLHSDWNTILSEVWEKPEGDEYYFKKSHATAYAIAITVQMNLICEQINLGNFSD